MLDKSNANSASQKEELSLGLKGIRVSYFSILKNSCNNVSCWSSHFCVQLWCTLWKTASEALWDTLQLCNTGDALLAYLKAQLNSCFWVCEPVRPHILPVCVFELTYEGSLKCSKGWSMAVTTSPNVMNLMKRKLISLLFCQRRAWVQGPCFPREQMLWATGPMDLLSWSS